MPRKQKTHHSTGSYEVWSRGKTDAWMHGMGLIDQGDRCHGPAWRFSAVRHYHASECSRAGRNPVPGTKRRAILGSFFKKTGEPSYLVINDPFYLIRELHRTGQYFTLDVNWQTLIEKCGASFLEQFSKCGSLDFNGALCLHGPTTLSGFWSACRIWETLDFRYGQTFVVKDSHTLIELCAHGGIHVASKDRNTIELFVRAYRHHTNVDLQIAEELTN